MNETTPTFHRLSRHLPAVVLLLVVLMTLWVRVRLLALPIERDEGEYGYFAQLLLEGVPPYLHAYSMKLPGVSMAYALFLWLFGHSPWGIHLGLLLVNGGCIVLVFLLGQRLLGREPALLAAAVFASLSLSKSVYGAHAHATHFVLLFSLAGFLLLLRAVESRRHPGLLLSGLCFGVAFLMKQQAALLTLFALLYLGWRFRRGSPEERIGPAAFPLFILCAALPYAAVCLWIVAKGSFDRFWFWTVTYAAEYVSGLPLDEGVRGLGKIGGEILLSNPLLWLLAAGGAALAAAGKLQGDRPFLAGFLLFSFLAVCPGLYFRNHYFVLLLPAAALLAAATATASRELLKDGSSGTFLRTVIPSLLVLLSCGYGFCRERADYFQRTPAQVSYWTFGENPFAAAAEIGGYLRSNSSPQETVAILGSEPEILFHARRRSATGHIYMYGLMEDHPYAERMQREMIREIEENRPKFCVFTRLETSWLARPSSSRTLLDWFDGYVEQYEKVGAVDLQDGFAYSYWGGNAAAHTAATKGGVVIYRRKQ